MYKNILVTVDLTDPTSWRKALPAALELCRASGATLHMLSVVPDFGMTVVGQYFPKDFQKKAVEHARQELQDLSAAQVPADVTVKKVVAYGTIYEEILATAKKIDADLIVIASHRPELKDYLIGPNAARVVRHSDRSVLVVRE